MESYPLGPASWPLWLRKMMPYARRFANAASFHDWAYDHMGDEWGRRWADSEFFELMLDECVFETPKHDVHKFSGILGMVERSYTKIKFFCAYVQSAVRYATKICFAFLYFALVRSFGWSFFRYTETCGKLPKR